MRAPVLSTEFEDCQVFYLEDCLARGQSVATVSVKRSDVGGFIRWCRENQIVDLNEVTLEVLETYRAYLYRYRQPRSGKPLDIATRRNRLTAVKVFLRRLWLRKIIGSNPATYLELPGVPRRLPKAVLTEEEIEAILYQTLLHGWRGLRDRAVLETYYATGIRRMELANLDLRDLDEKSGLLTVRRGKGSKDRRVPIAPRACGWVSLYTGKVRPKLAKLKSGQALFLANDGMRYRANQLTRIASSYVKRAGIEKAGACNLFRHSTATLMHENGADLRYVQEMLGHADISTTQIYMYVSPVKLKEVYQRAHPAARTPISEESNHVRI